jgi:uncharacterized protein YoaH (UPF0181 family)
MKSIQNQYIDLKEGRMSQHNFMRNLRMSMPQYITNVTSFKDAVRILKNKAILTENALGKNVELYQKYLDELNDVMGDGLSYADAIVKVADENRISQDALSTMVPEQSVGNKAYADNYDELYEAKDPIEDTIKSYLIKGYSYTEAIKLTAAEQGMDEEVLMSQYPQDTVDIEGYEDEEDDEEFLNMIVKAKQEKEEEEAIKGGFGIQDPLEEANGEFPRDPEEMAQAIADEFGKELLSLSGIEREKMAISHAYEKILNSGHPKAKIIARNLAFGYADEDWPMEYISTLNQKLKTPTPEIPMFKGTRDALDSLSIKEGKKKKAPKKELHPNQIHPSELRMGIKAELEHTDELDKAKKIALDHLAENPYYYTALKLAGVESPSAPKAKVPVAFKKEVAAETELVDKINAMKPVKGFEKAKASSNKAKKETNSGVKGVEELTHNAQSVRGLQKFAATGGKMKTIKLQEEIDPEIEGKPSQAYLDFLARKKQGKELMQATNTDGVKFSVNDMAVAPDGKEIKITGFTTGKDGKMKAMYSAGMFADVYNLDDLEKKSSFRPGVDLGKSFDKFKSQLEVLVRKAIAETFDGRDNLTDVE